MKVDVFFLFSSNAALTSMWFRGLSNFILQNNISEDIMFSFPSICNEGSYEMIKNIEMSEILNDYIKITEKELIQERDSVLDLL